MPKKKKGRRRQGLFSKALNIGLILLGLSRPISIMMGRPSAAGVQQVINEATFGLSGAGGFDLEKGLLMYSPAGAAIGLGKLKSYLMRHFPVR